jgi:hypothetical protein
MKWKKIIDCMWMLVIGFSIGITPSVFQYADAVRGYDATGGEIFTPILPLMLFLATRTERKDEQHEHY